jgi:hypothetical protein
MVNNANMHLHMNWCCGGFRNFYQEAGRRGVSVLVGRWLNGASFFVLQYRAVDKGFEGIVQSTQPGAIVGTTSEVHIQFCPWCGCNLSENYKDKIDSLTRSGLLIPVPGVDEIGFERLFPTDLYDGDEI